MLKREYEVMFRVEERHWWFAGKRRIVFDQLLRRLPGDMKNPRLLDVGCGAGIALAGHARIGEAFGIDFSEDAVGRTAARGIRRIARASVLQLPFPSDTFDVVTSLDVLYHRGVESDTAALAEIHRALKPGGLFVMTDSAFRWLWGKHDVAMHAARRYSRPELARLLNEAHFKILKISYMNFFLLPLVFLKRKITSLMPGAPRSDVGEVNPVLNRALGAIFGTERIMLRYVNLPAGASIIAVARKP